MRETKDAIAAGMSMKVWKVLFTLSKKEHLCAVRWWSSFSKIKVKTLSFRTLETTFDKDTCTNRTGNRALALCSVRAVGSTSAGGKWIYL